MNPLIDPALDSDFGSESFSSMYPPVGFDDANMDPYYDTDPFTPYYGIPDVSEVSEQSTNIPELVVDPQVDWIAVFNNSPRSSPNQADFGHHPPAYPVPWQSNASSLAMNPDHAKLGTNVSPSNPAWQGSCGLPDSIPAPKPDVKRKTSPIFQPYNNSILNEFAAEPETALRIIDRFFKSFEPELERALQKAVPEYVAGEDEVKDEVDDDDEDEEDEKEVKSRKMTRSSLGKPNKRTAHVRKAVSKIKSIYETASTAPSPWGDFRYTKFGELVPGETFCAADIQNYLYNNPLNVRRPDGTLDAKRSKLTLWVQNAPADRADVYPNPEHSSRCRFRDCPVRKGTITKGTVRVCFDEQRYPDTFKPNPYHNAGYVHLFCLEKFLDFARICKDFNVQPDTRKLLEGSNPMAITKDNPKMAKIVRHYRDNSLPYDQVIGGRPSRWFEYSLTAQLSTEYLYNLNETRVRQLNRRDGNSIDKHKGNLDVMVELKANKAAAKPKKRKYSVEDSDDEYHAPSSSIRKRRRA